MANSGNRQLHTARRTANDEFYTQRQDVERELRHYRQYFKDKVVYCNCDDPRVSNFFKFFAMKFEAWGLKKLVATCYKNQNSDIFSPHDSERAVYLEYTGDKDGNRLPDYDEVEVKPLQGNGDFRSPECVELLKQADIVCTNPPFSLFREYVAQLIKYDKKFLIIGNKNAISYKEIFPLIMADRLWVGMTPMGRDMLFDVPPAYAKELVNTKTLGSSYKIENGVVKGRSTSIWFTNLDHSKRNLDLPLWKEYSPEEYPAYDNYDAINVDKVKHIPCDYAGAMGVPISFLDKYCPEQFDILGFAKLWDDCFKSHKFYNRYEEVRLDGAKTGMTGTKANGYPVMLGRAERGNSLVLGERYVHVKYARVFIRNRNPEVD